MQRFAAVYKYEWNIIQVECTMSHDVTPKTADMFDPKCHIHQMLSYTAIGEASSWPQTFWHTKNDKYRECKTVHFTF